MTKNKQPGTHAIYLKDEKPMQFMTITVTVEEAKAFAKQHLPGRSYSIIRCDSIAFKKLAKRVK
jgi:hypothetical protein